jgi:energy-coupling factor transport system permease protein
VTVSVTSVRRRPVERSAERDRLPRDVRRLPRPVHPVAWWLWAAGMATAASRTTNPLLLVLVLVVCGFVVSARRTEAPWARAFHYYLILGCTVLAIRLFFRVLLGGGADLPADHVLVRLPSAALPSWTAGIRLGGAVTAEGALAALYDGLRLATLLCCIGAANALANPKRALRVLPGALYELGVAVVISITVAPQLVESIARVRRARLLRGGHGGRFRALRRITMPVLQDALDRSVNLAAAMDARGYGRSAGASRAARRLTAALLLTGLTALAVGMYGLLDRTAPGILRLPAILLGVVGCCLGLAVGGHRVRHTAYRPDTWRLAEWAVTAAGVTPALVLLIGRGYGVAELTPVLQPLHWPTLPVVPTVAILLGAVAAFAAPPPSLPRGDRPAGR